MNECSYTIDIYEDIYIYEDTWGFYVDIEKNNVENIFKPCEKIQYQPNDLTYASDYYEEYEPKHIDRDIANLLIKFSSTTLATIGLTYLIFCIL